MYIQVPGVIVCYILVTFRDAVCVANTLVQTETHGCYLYRTEIQVIASVERGDVPIYSE